MSRSYLLPAGADLVGFICDRIIRSGHRPEECLVLFPGRRPVTMLAQRLAHHTGHALAAPQCLAIDDWVAETARALGFDRATVEAADGAALIWQLHPDRKLPGSGAQLHLEEFLAWGFELFSDFEELLLEGVKPADLAAVEALVSEPLPAAFGRQLAHLGQWYGDFYQALEQRGLCTRSSTYAWVALQGARLDLSRFKTVIAAGFYGLSGAEQKVIELLLAHANAALVLRDGPGIDRTIKRLRLKPEPAGEARTKPKLQYISAGDSHGQVMAAAAEINPCDALSGTVLVLPKPETVFPVIHHLLPRLGADWNISMGYPLTRTPLAGLLQALAQAHEARDGENYFLPHYLSLLLHPYVKNLSYHGASYPTRILLHAVEEVLIKQGRRLVSPRALCADPAFRAEVAQRIAGLEGGNGDIDRLLGHLEMIHDLLLHPFERIGTVDDFARKVQDVVSAVAEHSTANKHPYAARFFYAMTDALSGLRHSLLAAQPLDSVHACFALLERFTSQSRVPLPGTPLQGLQVLGFLETRNLSFDRVVLLDANEGVLPVSSAVDTLLPQALRQQLGLPTAGDRELIDRYHFENLVAGAREAVLCYSQGGGAQRSRLIEQLVWREQQDQRSLAADRPRTVHFRASFAQLDPEPIAKTPQMMEAISRLSFSPTMLDCYLHCGLRFCYQYLMRIRERDQAAADVDASEVGTLVHLVLKRFFEKKQRGPCAISQPDFAIMDAVAGAVFDEAYGKRQDGNSYLIRSQVKTRMAAVLAYHRDQLPPFAVASCEHEIKCTVELPGAGLVPVNGKLDRIDDRGGETMIVDYKTGSSKFPSFDNFIAQGREQWPHWLRSVQLPFYIMLRLAERGGSDVTRLNSELLLLREQPIKRRTLFPEGADRGAMYKYYLDAIARLVCEIKDPAKSFADTWKPEDECQLCPYKVLCGRQWVQQR